MRRIPSMQCQLNHHKSQSTGPAPAAPVRPPARSFIQHAPCYNSIILGRASCCRRLPALQPITAAAASGACADQPSTSGRDHTRVTFAAPRHSSHDGLGRLLLKNLTYAELQEWCLSVGESTRRAEQLWRWMYYDDHWAGSFQEAVGVQNGFSNRFATAAAGIASLDGGLKLQQVAKAADGTMKLVLLLTEGEGKGGTVEAVLIPAQHRTQGKLRMTLCVSSQVGCAMNCQFCYTGRMGLSASLSTAQIVEQMVAALRVLRAEGAELDAITNVVFMGMGEPLHNLPCVEAAVEIMCHPRGLHMSHNKVTISTVGLVTELQQLLSQQCPAQLAVSLHATTDEVRNWIVPVNRRHKLVDLMALLAQHFPRHSEPPQAQQEHQHQQPGRNSDSAGGSTSSSSYNSSEAAAVGRASSSSSNNLLEAVGGGSISSNSSNSSSSSRARKSRRVLIEYTMLEGVNDSLEDAARLVQLLEPVNAKVNLIQFNPYVGTRFKPSSLQAMLAFRSVLVAAGRVCTIRASRGDDEMAACGQLGDPGAPNSRGAPLLPVPERFEPALQPAGAAAHAHACVQ